jgi:hypothetical protein
MRDLAFKVPTDAPGSFFKRLPFAFFAASFKLSARDPKLLSAIDGRRFFFF